MKTRTYRSAGGVVIDSGRMLLLDRPKRNEIRLPKGHIEPGESPEQTALREVQEEGGLAALEIVADLGSQLVEFEYKKAHYRRTEYYYLMRREGDQPFQRPPKDVRDFHPMWIPLDEAVGLLTYVAEKDVAERAIAVYEDLLGSVQR